jgi:hypothetical protein
MDKNKLKETATKVKNHLLRQKFAYAFGAIALGAVVLQQSNNKSWTEFLTSKGIDPDEFFNPEAFAEMQ